VAHNHAEGRARVAMPGMPRRRRLWWTRDSSPKGVGTLEGASSSRVARVATAPAVRMWSTRNALAANAPSCLGQLASGRQLVPGGASKAPPSTAQVTQTCGKPEWLARLWPAFWPEIPRDLFWHILCVPGKEKASKTLNTGYFPNYSHRSPTGVRRGWRCGLANTIHVSGANTAAGQPPNPGAQPRPELSPKRRIALPPRAVTHELGNRW